MIGNLQNRSSLSSLGLWLLVLLFVAVCLALRQPLPWLSHYPSGWTLPIAPAVDAFSTWVADLLQPVTRGAAWLLAWPMDELQAFLQWVPWPIMMAIVGLIALRAGGPRLAAFAAATLIYILVAGYWRQSMNTLALVLLAVPISVLLGFMLGVFAHKGSRAKYATEVALDLMQTIPAFAYLIPLLLLFGFGPVVGLIASTVYAIPPMVRNTLLGLETVPSDIKEAGEMSGCTPRQRFWFAEVPTAMPQILVGINQSTMAAFSIVIIASIIGGFADIGWEVLSSMRKAAFGQSLLSGLVIALLAMVIDRITLGFATKGKIVCPKWLTVRTFWSVVAILGVASLVMHLSGMADALPLSTGPGLIDAEGLNAWVLSLVSKYADPLENFKNAFLYFVILPLRIGMLGAVAPMSWGISLTPTVIGVYVGIIGGGAAMLWRFMDWRWALTLVVGGLIFFFGLSNFPWPALLTLVIVLIWRSAGTGVAVFAFLSLVFVLVLGLWLPLMQTAYLCSLAVVLCLAIGGLIGLWAAHSDRVSKIVRPINDTLQTMPQFVFLIPALMFFKVGELTALIAIMLYVIVPPIRYVEHGIRNVRIDCVEAGQQCGCTGGQLLFFVKLPLAMPVVMLGLNQTIMAALSMVVIAAMVGTKDLGQQVYIALGKADAGLGLTSGLAIALVAMVADRTIRGWAESKQMGPQPS